MRGNGVPSRESGPLSSSEGKWGWVFLPLTSPHTPFLLFPSYLPPMPSLPLTSLPSPHFPPFPSYLSPTHFPFPSSYHAFPLFFLPSSFPLPPLLPTLNHPRLASSHPLLSPHSSTLPGIVFSFISPHTFCFVIQPFFSSEGKSH